MSSLIKSVLSDLDNQRQRQIKILDDLGYPVTNDMTFHETNRVLENEIPNTEEPIYSYDCLNPDNKWKRPKDRPDLKEIFDNSNTIENFIPIAVFLLDNKNDNLVLESLPNGQGITIVTSDNSIYTLDQNMTHTWDKTKDINTYRYIIVYYKYRSYFNNPIRSIDVLECFASTKYLPDKSSSDNSISTIQILNGPRVIDSIIIEEGKKGYVITIQGVLYCKNIELYSQTNTFSNSTDTYIYGIKTLILQGTQPFGIKTLDFQPDSYIDYNSTILYTSHISGNVLYFPKVETLRLLDSQSSMSGDTIIFPNVKSIKKSGSISSCFINIHCRNISIPTASLTDLDYISFNTINSVYVPMLTGIRLNIWTGCKDFSVHQDSLVLTTSYSRQFEITYHNYNIVKYHIDKFSARLYCIPYLTIEQLSDILLNSDLVNKTIKLPNRYKTYESDTKHVIEKLLDNGNTVTYAYSY